MSVESVEQNFDCWMPTKKMHACKKLSLFWSPYDWNMPIVVIGFLHLVICAHFSTV